MVTALLRLYTARFFISPDGICYIDLARAFAKGDWHTFVSTYWSPLYPLVLGTVSRLLHPSPVWEIPLAHLVNFLAFLACLGAFGAFFRRLQELLSGDEVLRSAEFVAFAYAVFLWGVFRLVGTAYVTPDLLVVVATFLDAALLLEITLRPRFAPFAALGLCLGIGYWAKAAMLPVGVLCIGLAAWQTPKRQRRLVAVSVLVFAMVALPLVAMLSRSRHRFTTGDVGRYAYILMVTSPGMLFSHWQGEPIGSGTPIHPVRTIAGDPVIYEFDGPIGGTYPPVFDPPYWHAGDRIRFSAAAQIGRLAASAKDLTRILVLETPVALGALVCCLLFCGLRSFRPWHRRVAAVAMLGGLPIAMYAIVYIEDRYIGGFVTLLFVSLAAAFEAPAYSKQKIRGALALSAVVLVLPLLVERSFYYVSDGSGTEKLAVYQAMRQAGLQPGDKVLVIRRNLEPPLDDSPALLAGVRVVADTAGNVNDWNSEQEDHLNVVACEHGVRAIVSELPVTRPTWIAAGNESIRAVVCR